MAEYLPFRRRDDGRQLVEVPDKDHLDPAEPLLPVRPVEPHELFDAVEEVGPHHGDLIDNDRVEFLVDRGVRAAYLFHLLRGDARLEPEKRMDRLPLDIERRNTGRRKNSDVLLRVPPKILKQRRLPRPRLPRDKDVLIGPLHNVEGPLKFRIYLDE